MRRQLRKLGVVAVLVGLPLMTTGCFPGSLPLDGFLTFFLRGIGVPLKKGAPKIKETLEVPLSVEYGGLSGTYTIGFGDYGSVSGTAKIKGQKKAQLKLKNDEQANDLIAAMVLDRSGQSIDVTKSKVVYKGSQTTGGVKKKFKGIITFKGVVSDGADIGKKVRGKIRSKGSFE